MDKARETALKALIEIETKNAYSNLALKKLLRSDSLDARDRAFISELVYGTVSRRLTLDWIISQFSKTKLKKISLRVLSILRLGVYQIMFLDRVPDSAACDTSVELAKKYAKESSGFVNGILRNISRNSAEIHMPENTGSDAYELSIKYSFPEFLVEDWLNEYGREFTEKILESLLTRPDFYVRVNTLKTTPEAVIDELSAEGFEVRPGRFLNEALIIRNVSDISSLKAYSEGRITVQDESSMLVTKILDPRPGEKILDICAAPGGKSTHIAEHMKNEGHIAAWDVHEHKVKLIWNNAQRLGVKIIEPALRDALEPAAELEGRFHRVLVDAPCSGTGIIRRKPDIKWHRKPEDFGKLVEMQQKILYNASRYVMPGGVLVYSTCSLDPRENSAVVNAFVRENTDFILEPISDLPGIIGDKKETAGGMLNLYPHIDGTDGFFIAKIRKNK
ncbi:MAG: 16S rRNA (cytosine(967)-C(5))-methyltransferase RsmB [Clostridiaceae bacterium]|nr:16S rRNA (cytosine(967)-C(5))-methyltransferase RsmB [Clostridiaceae bacterium]